MSDAGSARGSTFGDLPPADQMLKTIAPNDENAEAFTVVASSPAVNSLRMSKSRSMEGAD